MGWHQSILKLYLELNYKVYQCESINFNCFEYYTLSS